MTPTLYFDLGSPYAFLTAERAEEVLGVVPVLEPILLGAFFERRGYGSWANTDRRGAGQAEIEARAARYGLPELRWPAMWPPTSTLSAMRAATWATNEGGGERFARGAFRAAFLQGENLADVEVLAGIAIAVGLDPQQMLLAIRSQAIKDQLRDMTERAWNIGVRGVPTLQAGGDLFFGDDQLEAAAAALNPS